MPRSNRLWTKAIARGMAWALVAIPLALVSPFFAQLLAEESSAAPRPLDSGEEVPSFFLREATSRRPHLAVCLVCRYGDRPVLMMLAHRRSARIDELVKKLDMETQSRLALGMRGFVLLCAEDNRSQLGEAVTLAAQRELVLPVATPIEPSGAPRKLRCDESCDLELILYANQRVSVVSRLRETELTETIEDATVECVMLAADRLLAARNAP